MNALVGKAMEEDEMFWNQGLFAEAEQQSEDDDFESAQESSSQGRDSFDSDFLKGSVSGASSDKEGDEENKDGKAVKKRAQVDDDFDSEEERAALDNDARERRKNKKTVQFNIKSNVERLKKLKKQKEKDEQVDG